MLPGFRFSHSLGFSPGNNFGNLFYQEASFLKVSLELRVGLKIFLLDEVTVQRVLELKQVGWEVTWRGEKGKGSWMGTMEQGLGQCLDLICKAKLEYYLNIGL